MFIVFDFSIQVETGYSNVKMLMKLKVVKVVKFIRYTVSQLKYWRGKHQSGSVCLSHVVLYWKDKDFTLIYQYCWGYFTFFVKFLMEVHGI